MDINFLKHALLKGGNDRRTALRFLDAMGEHEEYRKNLAVLDAPDSTVVADRNVIVEGRVVAARAEARLFLQVPVMVPKSQRKELDTHVFQDLLDGSAPIQFRNGNGFWGVLHGQGGSLYLGKHNGESTLVAQLPTDKAPICVEAAHAMLDAAAETSLGEQGFKLTLPAASTARVAAPAPEAPPPETAPDGDTTADPTSPAEADPNNNNL